MLKITQSNLKKIGLVTTLIGVTLFSILIEFMSADFDIKIFANVFYWARMVAINLAVICVLFSVRSLAKDKERQENESVKKKDATLEEAYQQLNDLKLNTEFESYIKKENQKRKKHAYIQSIRKKLRTCKNACKRESLIKDLETAEQDYDIAKVKYPKIKFSTIFGKITIKGEDNDLEEHETRDYADIIINKILMILAFSLLTSSFAFETYVAGWVTVFNIVNKLVQISLGAYFGAILGSDYIKGKLSSKLSLRINFVQQFLEDRKRIIKKDTDNI